MTKNNRTGRTLLRLPFAAKSRAWREPDPRTPRLLRRYDRALGKLRKQEARLRSRLGVAVQRSQAGVLQELASRLAEVIRHRRILEGLARTRAPGPELVVLSSMMLARSFRLCTETREEGMHFIAGIEFDGLAIGTHIIPFPYAHRSVAGAAGDPEATHRISIETHEARHRLLALIHSHPGSGPDANHPSSIDDRTQRLWEQGSRLIGGIWSRDGYLRWYSVAVPFKVEVIGSHMEKVDDRLFKLVPLES